MGRKHPHQEYIQVNTERILFICGGAFVGLDKIIRRRVGSNTLGFGRPHVQQTAEAAALPPSAIMRSVEPEDLLNFGLIPEFIGRLPMISVLDELSEEELVCVLTDTKNALTKQYTKLFAMDNVGLTFTKDALKGLAQEAARKGTGARALRAILEKLMLDLMYDLPSREDILEVTINRAVIDGKKSPLIRRKQDKEAA